MSDTCYKQNVFLILTAISLHDILVERNNYKRGIPYSRVYSYEGVDFLRL